MSENIDKLREEIIADAKDLTFQMKKFLEFLEKYEENEELSWSKED